MSSPEASRRGHLWKASKFVPFTPGLNVLGTLRMGEGQDNEPDVLEPQAIGPKRVEVR